MSTIITVGDHTFDAARIAAVFPSASGKGVVVHIGTSVLLVVASDEIEAHGWRRSISAAMHRAHDKSLTPAVGAEGGDPDPAVTQTEPGPAHEVAPTRASLVEAFTAVQALIDELGQEQPIDLDAHREAAQMGLDTIMDATRVICPTKGERRARLAEVLDPDGEGLFIDDPRGARQP